MKTDGPDGPALAANQRLMRYITTQLAADPRKWGEPKSGTQMIAAEILAGYKNAWARDVREAFSVDPETGLLMRCTMAEQERMWIDCMQRAEEDISKFMAEKTENMT